jgi:hypothetical protein
MTEDDTFRKRVKNWADSYGVPKKGYTQGKQVGAIHAVNILKELLRDKIEKTPGSNNSNCGICGNDKDHCSCEQAFRSLIDGELEGEEE